MTKYVSIYDTEVPRDLTYEKQAAQARRLRALQRSYETVLARKAAREALLEKKAKWRISWKNMVKLAERQKVIDALLGDMATIQKECCKKWGISKNDMISHRRDYPTMWARIEFYWRCKRETTATLPQIAKHCGNRDHTSALSGIRTYERLRRTKAGLEPKRRNDTFLDFDKIIVDD